jgi:hypothetical protein
MSAAAVISIRIRRIFAYLRKRGACTPDTAIPVSEAPYSDRWYFRSLIRRGAIKIHDGKCYLDEQGVSEYYRNLQWRVTVFVLVVALIGLLFVLNIL